MSLTPRRTKRPATPVRRPREDLSPIGLRDQTWFGSDRAHGLERLLGVQQSLQVILSRLRLAGRLALFSEKGEGPPERRWTRRDVILQMSWNNSPEIPPTHTIDPVQRLHRISVEYKRLDDRRDQ